MTFPNGIRNDQVELIQGSKPMNFGFSPNQFHRISLDFKILCAIQPNYKRSYTLHERDMEKYLCRMKIQNRN